MLHVRTKIEQCGTAANPRHRKLSDIKGVLVHRFGWHDFDGWKSRGLTADAEGTAKFYATNGEAYLATGGKMPYTFVICHDGTVEQAAHLDVVVPHALRYNTEAIGIAVLGDFQILPPTEQQKVALIELCSILDVMGFCGYLKGHTEMEGAAGNTKKVCPGPLLDMNWVRETVRANVHGIGAALLSSAGGVL